MSYGISDIGKSASASFDSLEEAENALNALRDAGGFEIWNRASMTTWEALADFLFNEFLDFSPEYRAKVYCVRVRVYGERGKTHCYRVTVLGNTVKDVERAKSYIDKLS